MTTPAGWYDDPQDVRFIRYWDGFQWSAHAAPKVAAPADAAASQGFDTGPSSVLHYIVPVGRSWQSVVAPYLGLVSLLPVPVIGQLFGIGGIVLGAIALRRVSTGGHGTGRAITAIVLGSIGTIFGLIVLFNIAFST
jgi:tetrahydromethanopterin S-methyltransferase subunit C